MNVAIAELESQHHRAGSSDYALSLGYSVWHTWSSIIYHTAKITCTFIHHTCSTNFILHTGWNTILDRLNPWIMANHLTVMHISNILSNLSAFFTIFLKTISLQSFAGKRTVARHYKLPEEWLEHNDGQDGFAFIMYGQKVVSWLNCFKKLIVPIHICYVSSCKILACQVTFYI